MHMYVYKYKIFHQEAKTEFHYYDKWCNLSITFHVGHGENILQCEGQYIEWQKEYYPFNEGLCGWLTLISELKSFMNYLMNQLQKALWLDKNEN